MRATGAGRFLGALVRPVQAADAGAGEGRQGGRRRGRPGQDEHRRASRRSPGQLGIQSIPAVIAFQKGQPVDGFMGAVPGEPDQGAYRPRRRPGRGPGRGGHRRGRQPDRGGRPRGRRPRSTRRCWSSSPTTSRRSPASPSCSSTRARSRTPSGCSRWSRRPRPPTRRWPASAPPSTSPSRPPRWATSPASSAAVEADPDAHQARFDLALALAARGEREQAVDHLIEIVKRDRDWNDDGARKQLASVLRGLGRDGPGHDPRAAQALGASLLVRRRLALRPQQGGAMSTHASYKGPADCPAVIPVFPLAGALLLPRGQMPLNIFEPRYLAMVDDAHAHGPDHRHDPARSRGRRARRRRSSTASAAPAG